MLHETGAERHIEQIQAMAAALVAGNKAGVGLRLIGGFRYRLLNKSPRSSDDVDYCCTEPLEAKREALIGLFRRKLIPAVKRTLGYDGDVRARRVPGDGSETTKTIELAFYRFDMPSSRIEIPVDLTQVACFDDAEGRTVDARLYLTASEQDMVENKVVALFNRTFTQARDFVDIFLFESHLGSDSAARVARKLEALSYAPADINRKLDKLKQNRSVHVRSIDKVFETQFSPDDAESFVRAGGGKMVFNRVLEVIENRLELRGSDSDASV
ncbi:MAG: hypothetical protein GF331_25165 [Chitinivibrionales bacterium]|nr:hypothetical protein [Chitinivibrionales bacterium]